MLYSFLILVATTFAVSTPSAPSTQTAPQVATATCEPEPREVRGDDEDNDCDGVIDEPLTAAQLASLVDATVGDCTCKDAATSEGRKARALALKAMTAANRLGPGVDPDSVVFTNEKCDTVELKGYEWDGSVWATAGSASRAARAATAAAAKNAKDLAAHKTAPDAHQDIRDALTSTNNAVVALDQRSNENDEILGDAIGETNKNLTKVANAVTKLYNEVDDVNDRVDDETAARKEGDKLVSFGVTLGGFLGGNTKVNWTEFTLDEDSNVLEKDKYTLRYPGSAGGFVDGRLGYRFAPKVNVGLGFTATLVGESTQFKPGKSVGVTGNDQVYRLTVLGEPDVKKGSLGIGGGLGIETSSTAQGAAQCKVYGWGLVVVGEGVYTFGESPFGIRFLAWGGPEKIGFTPTGEQDERQYDGATFGGALGFTVAR